MKKVLTLLSLLMLVTGSFAQETIQSTFYGCTLGQSTLKDIVDMVAKQEFEVLEQTDNALLISGSFQVDGIETPLCKMGVNEDVFNLAVYFAPKNSATIAQIDLIKTKYLELAKKAQDNEMLTLMLSMQLSQHELDPSKGWVCANDMYSMNIIELDSAYILEYIYIKPMLEWNESENKIKSLDYDKANAVNGVAGCIFGENRQKVIEAFRSRSSGIIKSDAHSTTLSDISFGGQYFKRGELFFIDNKFIACSFDSNFNTWKYEEAKMMYDGLCSQFNRKYSNGCHFDIDKDDMRSYYGMYQQDYQNGEALPIVISLQKSVSRGGNTYYYVTLSYFIFRVNTIFDDEI